MIGRQHDGRVERNRDQNLSASYRTFATGCLIGNLINPVHDGVRDSEARIQKRRSKSQGPRAAIAGSRIDFDVGWRIDSRRYVAGRWVCRIEWKHVIHLDFYVADTGERRS